MDSSARHRMNAPRIQYARTSDGVDIAYWEIGEGPPLVHSWGLASHAQLEWQFPEIRRWYERLARRRRLISYEKRGVGLSQREVADFSLAAHVADLEAVVQRLGLGPFALFAPMISGPVAVAYAAGHPELSLRLVLWNSWRRHADIASAAPIRAMEALLLQDWTTYTEAYAHTLLGWDQGDPAHRYAAMMRESISEETYRRRLEAAATWDVTDLLPLVRARTLVIQRKALSWLDLSVGKEIAARIPDARFVVQDGASVPPFLGDMEGVAQAVDAFLAESALEAAPGPREGGGAAAPWPNPALELSPRQKEVLALLASGKTNREIASELVLSLRTVERHVNDIYARLGVRNRTEAAAIALRARPG